MVFMGGNMSDLQDDMNGAGAGGTLSARTCHEVTGILAVDKCSGPTSHDVVRSVRRILRQRRVGHCGTLDPAATGLLLICAGRYTRLADLLSNADKDYQATIQLGATSDTYDGDGQVIPQTDAKDPGTERLYAAISRFRGRIMQVPPPFSAIRTHGVRSYVRARRGESVSLEARSITVHAIEVVDYHYPFLCIRVRCSKGTYIRSLAHDLGQCLGTGGYLRALRRTRVGRIVESQALTLEELQEASGRHAVHEHLIPATWALDGFPQLTLAEAELTAFTQGRAVALEAPPEGAADLCLVLDRNGAFRGLGMIPETSDKVLPRKVIVPAGEPAVPTGD